VPPDQQCAFDDGQGGLIPFVCGGSEGPTKGLGCDLVGGCVTTGAACPAAGTTKATCSSQVLLLGCNAGQPFQLDCAAQTAVCAANGGGSGGDANCEAATGAACLVGQGIPIGCGDATGPKAGQGCDLGTGNCATTTATCTEAASGTQFKPTCSGSNAVIACMQGAQPIFIDCSLTALGGAQCTNGQCTGIPAGKPCDTGDPSQAIFVCAQGLTCKAQPGGGLGKCG
jgi:hypothetical protein